MNLLKNNWPVGGASGDPDLGVMVQAGDGTLSGVKFGTSWWSENPYYQIHVKPASVSQKPKVLGANRFEYLDLHDIHVFAKGNNAKDTIWKMQKEIENILNTRVANSITGISFLKVDGPVNLPEEDPMSKVEHSRYRVLLYYHKIVS
jgi:hypothetical protein